MSERPESNPLPPALVALHRELGIPASYATDRGLTLFQEAEAGALVEVGINEEGRAILLTTSAANAWSLLRRAAARVDIELVSVSGFRSIARQAELIRVKLAAGQSIAEILRYIAAPGFSEHHTGRALDLASSDNPELEEEFSGTAEFAWLTRHAASFGFTLSYPRGNPHGFGFEPWHWYWSGKKGETEETKVQSV